jgi:hypothetical protein
MIVKPVALLFLIAGLSTCTSPLDSPPKGSDGVVVPQQDIATVSAFSGIETQTGSLILDPASWQAAWESIFANYAPAEKPPLPAINFDSSVVVLAAAGTTPTQLFSFQITEVRFTGNSLHVRVESVWPNCGGLPVVTAPVHVVRVPHVATQADFTFVSTSDDCS